MEIIKQTVPLPPQDAQAQEVTLKEGEEINVEVLKKLKANGFLLSVKGRIVSADLDFEPSSKNFQAVVSRSPNGSTQLRFYPPLPEKAQTAFNHPAQQDTFVKQQQILTSKQDLNQQISAKNSPQSQQISHTENRQPLGTAFAKDIKLMPQKADALFQSESQKQIQQPLQNNSIRPALPVVENNITTAVKLPPNTLPFSDGEQTEITVVKMLDNGKTLISVKDSLFEVKLEPQLFKTLFAEAKLYNDSVLLTFAKLPVENLNPQYVKQQISGFDIEKLMQAFGKFNRANMAELTQQTLKDALKNSGLTFENKLLNDNDVSGDEKFRAFLTGDNQAKDGITKMQITNLVIADGVLSFLKTKDENVGDTLFKLKRGSDGSNTVYVSTNFSELGETLIVIKQIHGSYTVSVKTEKDISEYMNDINVDNGTVRWFKFNSQDLHIMNPSKELNSDLGNFEVII